MKSVSYSWLAASACAPLVAVLSLWTVYIFHTYRRHWRTVDLFLLAVGTQELVTALYAFGFAILNLFSPRVGPACSFILWGLTATRTFQIFTLASLVVDRALTIRWPYKYRFSVRRNQIRYHIAVTAVIAVIVGVAAVFARSPDELQQYHCSVHPLGWDYRFSIFNICLHSVLMITVLVCCFDLEVNHCRTRHRKLHFPDPSIGPENSTGTATSSSVTSNSSESTRPLHSPGRQESRRPYNPEQTSSDFRWTAVEVVSCLCYLLNHLPCLVLNILATLIPPFWSPWHENIILWLRLVEGLVIPLVFYLTDSHHRSALRRAFQRRSGKFSDFGDDRHSPLYLEGNTKLSPFGSVTPIGIITNYRRTPGKKGKLQHSNAQKKSLWRTRAKKQILPSVYGVDTVLSPSHLTSNLQTVVQTKPQPEKDDVTKLSSLQMDAWRDADAHIYATLSDNLSNLSYQSSLPEDNVFGVGGAEAEEEIYGGSLTTVANADFEFHYTCLGDVRSGDVFRKYDSEMELSGSEEEVWKYPDNSSEKSSISETVQDLVIHIDSPKDSSRVKGSPENEKTVQKTIHQSNDIIPFHVYRLLTEELSRSISPRPQNSWFSMNDLDHIGDKSDSTNSDSEEAVFVVPVKSESMMSLYKIPLPLDNTPSKSRSESNLFWRRNSSDLQHKPSLKEEQFASEGKLLDVLWKNNRSSLLLGRSSRVRKAKKRKTNNKQKHCRNQFSRKSQEELVGTIRLDTGPVLSEENMQPPNTLQNVLASGEKNEKDNLRSTVKPEFV